MKRIKNISVFCGSSSGCYAEYLHAAILLGKILAEKEIGVIYGGADIGLMGAIADSVIRNNGQVTGILPQIIFEKVKHKKLTKLIMVDSIQERKKLMCELGDAFITLPGGYGTLEELFEILTWAQLGFHTKPCGILNVRGYFDLLFEFINQGVSQRFIKPVHREILVIDADVRKLIDKIVCFKPHTEGIWGCNRFEIHDVARNQGSSGPADANTTVNPAAGISINASSHSKRYSM